MTALIAISTRQGCVGRCDAKCYNSKNSKCNCICGGKNHGVGRIEAADNTRQLAEKWIAEYKERKNLKEVEVRINRPLVDQLSLFSLF